MPRCQPRAVSTVNLFSLPTPPHTPPHPVPLGLWRAAGLGQFRVDSHKTQVWDHNTRIPVFARVRGCLGRFPPFWLFLATSTCPVHTKRVSPLLLNTLTAVPS